MNNRRGFTLMELIIVIAVVAILSVILVSTMGSMTTDARAAKAGEQGGSYLNSVNNAVYLHESNCSTRNCSGVCECDYVKKVDPSVTLVAISGDVVSEDTIAAAAAAYPFVPTAYFGSSEKCIGYLYLFRKDVYFLTNGEQCRKL